MQTIAVASFYRFVEIGDPRRVRDDLWSLCKELGLLGTIHVATEGINANVCGDGPALDTLIETLGSKFSTRFPSVRRSEAATAPFRRLKVAVRQELIKLGAPDICPAARTGKHVDPIRWNELLEDGQVRVIDTRNHYEISLGSFPGALNPGTEEFHRFPEFVERELTDDKEGPVAMFCTGGIRCEKASAYLLQQGFTNVYQLDGGILSYLEQIDDRSNLWQGECFVFDQRVSVNSDMSPSGRLQCFGCRRPITDEDLASPRYEPGISCPACFDALSETQRAAFAERRKQVSLASKRGRAHIGARFDKAAEANSN